MHWMQLELNLGVNMQHRYYSCECGDPDCGYANGRMIHCLVCGGFNTELLPECPGKMLTYKEHIENRLVNLRRLEQTTPSVIPKPLDTVGIEQ